MITKIMNLQLWCMLSLALFLLGCTASEMQNEAADMVVLNAKVTTQTDSLPNAQAVVVKENKIVFVGTDADAKKYIGNGTKVVDANGKRLIPGLVDSHSHFLRSGLSYTRELRWDGVPSLAQGLSMIKEQAQRTPSGEWVQVIGGWTPWQFKEKRLPTPEELTAAAPNTPVYVQYFYSAGVVNKKALELLGINKETKDPVGGRFERVNGVPTGLMLAEPHPGIFYGNIAALPSATTEIEANSTLHLFYELARFGLTGVIDAGGGGFNYPEAYSTSQKLAADGALPIRTSFYLFAQRPTKELEDFKAWSEANSAGTNFDPIKEFGFELDGAGEYLLWEAADFENFRWARPELSPTMEKNLAPILKLLIKKRWPFRIHATYEESIKRIVDVVEQVNNEVPLNGLRWSIEHGETITTQTAKRIHKLGGGLAIQNRMVFLGDDFVEMYGKNAAKYSPPLKDLYEMGIPLGMGTDATRGSTFNPWVSLEYMVGGKTASGRKIYESDNLLTREQALKVHTIGSAWFSGEEDVKGRIAVGQLADFVLLDKDYFEISEDEISSIRASVTVVDGKVVYADPTYEALNVKLPEILPNWSPVRYYGSYFNSEQ